MRRGVIIAVVVAIATAVAVGSARSDAPSVTIGAFSVALPIVLLAHTARTALPRIEAMERQRSAQVAALGSHAPVYLNVTGSQNLRPSATTFTTAGARQRW